MMKNSKTIAILALTVLAVAFAAAQGSPVLPGAGSPVVDGAMAKGEYGWMNTVGSFWLGVSLSKDGQTLTIGLAAKTSGWVSVGLGSQKMDGAYIIIAYFDGQQHIAEEIGKGHGHSVAPGKKLIASTVKTTNGMTYLEFSIPAAEYIKTGKLPLILGASNKADFISWHPMAQGTELTIGK
jgi:hypothetical protein